MEVPSQNINVSNNPETKGFDLSAGNTWIYPENYPVRDYQYNIVKKALYNNTLVCLPTGLGKTFIAAVVMYNFWRWYPFGKIVFLAPTKPLVAQQIDACHKVMGIPSIDTKELTGAVNQKNREVSWSKKKIIFATPQVFHNDLEKSIVPSHLIKCVVIDEAHKALGKHSYCECIRILSTQNQYFRILALSATPGNKIDKVHEVVQNLHISHVELRDENSIDIMPYVNKRKVDIILVPLSSELAAFKERYIVIMDRHVKLLIQCNILQAHTANISKGRIFHLLKDFQTKTNKSGNYKQILTTLNILLTMYHAYELMIRHGLRAFYKFYQTHSDKFWMHNENQLQELLHDIEIYLGPFPEIQLHSTEDEPEIPKDLVFGHNKFHKLKELLEHHFRSDNGNQKDTRAIVFVEYRDIVNEVYILLLQSKPIIRPQMFVGQASQKQKQQIKALEDFRSNRVNVLISTSIGEEGLDVGEVDLIICFDVSQHSPIRLVQRMGRTGRKRNGHIIVLVTDGKEHENLKSTLSRRDSLNNKILNTSNIFSSLYENNFRMIPNQFTPECHKIHIEMPKTPSIKDKKRKKTINKKDEICNTKQKEHTSITTQKSISQSSMMKFLNNSKCNVQGNTCNILAPAMQSINLQNTISRNKVKLLSNDNMGIEFLTLCTVKKSEEDVSLETVHKMDTSYIPISKSVTNFLNFIVPDMKILDCLSFLDIGLDNNLSISRSNCEDKNANNNNNNDDDDDIDIDDNFWCTIRNEKNVDNKEIKFENLLDESSDSDKTISHINDEIGDMKINLYNAANAFTAKNDKITFSHIEPSITKSIEPTLFENILDDSFSSIEDNSENENMTQRNAMSSNNSNILEKNIDRIHNTHKSIIDNFRATDNTDEFNHDISAFEFTKPYQTKIKQTNNEASFIDEMREFDFDDDDNVNEFIYKPGQNNSMHNTTAEKSLLSITQAINEVGRIKKNLEKSSIPSTSKENQVNENNSDWISVNIKNEIKNKKKDAISGIKNKLSIINHDFIAKSCNKQFLDQEDSDEDFMITEDSVKKFDELESSYFQNNSKSSKTENSYSYSTSKNIKVCGTSNKFCGLSLKRNKNIQLDMKNSSIFQTPINNRVCNTQDTNILESSNGTLKPTSSMNKKFVRKDSHKNKRRIKNEFIDDEVEVSSNASSDEIVETDEELVDFVSYTQNISSDMDMHAHYLQSIKSPIKRVDGFCFKKPQSASSDIEIYSQIPSQLQDTYLYDSFCVNEDVEPSIQVGNDSLLERAEKKLRRNKRKYRHLDKNNMNQTSKRKRINILNTSMSSEDEIEQLRRQVQKTD